MWSDLGLDTTLDQLARPDRREAVRLSDRALVLVANRLTAPASEHALAQWLESDFVCDRCGRRFIAAWRDDAERQASRTPRVRVAARQLQQWYRTLDQLLACKAQVESALFVRLRDLFSLQVDMVFYDLTSTYFEGRKPTEMGAHGHSRDGKPRKPAGAGWSGSGRRLADRSSYFRGRATFERGRAADRRQEVQPRYEPLVPDDPSP
jgi:hypothetical protein